MKFCTVIGGHFDFLVLSIEMPFNHNGKTPENAGVTSHYSIANVSGSRQIQPRQTRQMQCVISQNASHYSIICVQMRMDVFLGLYFKPMYNYV